MQLDILMDSAGKIKTSFLNKAKSKSVFVLAVGIAIGICCSWLYNQQLSNAIPIPFTQFPEPGIVNNFVTNFDKISFEL